MSIYKHTGLLEFSNILCIQDNLIRCTTASNRSTTVLIQIALVRRQRFLCTREDCFKLPPGFLCISIGSINKLQLVASGSISKFFSRNIETFCPITENTFATPNLSRSSCYCTFQFNLGNYNTHTLYEKAGSPLKLLQSLIGNFKLRLAWFL